MNQERTDLDKYIIAHCAKLELSLIDAASGGPSSRPPDFMKTIIRQKVQNPMFFEELDLAHVFNMMNYSRYLFLDFLEAHSMLIVGNQGSYDLHFFRVINALGRFKL